MNQMFSLNLIAARTNQSVMKETLNHRRHHGTLRYLEGRLIAAAFLAILAISLALTVPAHAQQKGKIFVAGDASGDVDLFALFGSTDRSFNGGFTTGDALAAGDVNGDGKAEILVAGDESGRIDIFDQLGNQIGSFNG
ncbi:FG-GAP repeat protein, partial [Candidatus Acetothermia bacterium]|nr:FG-GAP repeat protein [Candidatus Acetothermia bacterium]